MQITHMKITHISENVIYLCYYKTKSLHKNETNHFQSQTIQINSAEPEPEHVTINFPSSDVS